MLLLACKCLNIKISIKGSEATYLSSKTQNLSEDYVPTGFFPAGEVEVETQGVQQEHSYLVHRRQLGNYTIYRCLVCGVDTYCTRPNTTQVIVNNQLQYDSKALERLKNSANFSTIYGIVLRSMNGNLDVNMPDPKSAAFECLQTRLSSVQESLTSYLTKEEENMETRIRAFEDSQRTEFDKLKEKLKEEKKSMISLILSSLKYDDSNLGSETSPPTAVSNRREKILSSPKKKLSRVRSLPPQPSTEESDGLFSFEEDLTNEPFYTSNDDDDLDDDDDDDDNDDDDDAFDEPRVPRTTRSRAPLTYSSSVPIAVPMWNDQTATKWDDQESTPQDPEQIAASMQALAQSITDDNRYIFGDRPRPRLFTGDFNK